MYKDNLTAAHEHISSLKHKVKELENKNELLKCKDEKTPLPVGFRKCITWLIWMMMCFIFNIYSIATGSGWWLVYVAASLTGFCTTMWAIELWNILKGKSK